MWVGAWFSLVIFLTSITQYLTKATQGRKGFSAHSWRAHSPASQGSHGGGSVRLRSQGSHSWEAEKDKVNAGAHFSFFFFSFYLCIWPKIQAGGMVLATLRVGLPSAKTPGNVLRHIHSIMSWRTGKPATGKLTMTMPHTCNPRTPGGEGRRIRSLRFPLSSQ